MQKRICQTLLVVSLFFLCSNLFGDEGRMQHEPENIQNSEEKPQSDLITPVNENPISIDQALEKKLNEIKKPARGVILLIADGMGVGCIKYARELICGRDGFLEIDKFPVIGRMIDYPANGPVSDSAAAGTELVTGKFGRNKAISISPTGEAYLTLWEMAKHLGLKVGVVTDTRITHATPATFYAHVKDRAMEEEIASQLVRSGFDVFLGGGAHFFNKTFRKDGVDLFSESKKDGYEIALSKQDLARIVTEHNSKVIGLFADQHLSWSYMNVKNEPSLSEMSAAALQILGGKSQRFLLMIEAGKIDFTLHNNDLAELTMQMRVLEDTLKMLRDFVNQNPDVLLVVLSDHGNGGMSITEKFDPEKIRELATSTRYLEFQFKDKIKELPGYLKNHFSGKIALDEEKLKKFSGTNSNRLKAEAIGDLFNSQLGVELFSYETRKQQPVTSGHTGEDILIHSMGIHQNLFGGVMKIVDIPKKLGIALGLKFP
ncbi:MAG: alkaline phosphatase [Candidatus Riflebacteria bacterium]|nr:alkaline phosphatase [Candidatus Riflebacteria bacterium]